MKRILIIAALASAMSCGMGVVQAEEQDIA